ncbi:glycosyltransferase family 2 protein [Pelagerythrobacter marensis]|uniref:Putative dolichol monophosphate mannose synthase n=1 Tax=Pelagerythrobacter marensis TaxID=543877 RepID=A0A0G3X8A5_9SPHN|nr:glycosyltransferase family 2 protein [Pelagerythrobacter marensis]AKM06573.1 Putative dolichol monophosphate mannose synthase [Pelagerythrobacter marensis]
MTLRLAIVLPTLDERENIAPLLARIEQALGPQGWEAIVVDDASADGTADEARRIARADPRVRVIERIGRRGLSSAAIEGICATAAPFVAVMDADHQHDPAILPEMLAALETGECDVAVASRYVAGASNAGLASARRERGSRLAVRLARRLAGVDLSDPMSGYFAIRAEIGRTLAPRMSQIGFKVLLDLLASAPEPLRVREFPLQFAQRRSGASKLDRAVVFDFLVGLYDKTFGRVVPTRFALFGTVGGLGVVVHLAVLALLFRAGDVAFVPAQALATFAAMTFNFWLNNWLTYRDRRLRGGRALLRGWAGFCAACSVGAVANVAVAGLLKGYGLYWLLAAAAGILVGAVWNYALSSRFVWKRR